MLWHGIGHFIDVQPQTFIGVRAALQNQSRQTPQRLMLNVQQAKFILALLGKSLKPLRCEWASFRLQPLIFKVLWLSLTPRLSSGMLPVSVAMTGAGLASRTSRRAMTSRLPVGKRLFCCPRQGGAETTPPLQAFDLRWGLRASKEGRDLEAGTPTRELCPPSIGSEYSGLFYCLFLKNGAYSALVLKTPYEAASAPSAKRIFLYLCQ